MVRSKARWRRRGEGKPKYYKELENGIGGRLGEDKEENAKKEKKEIRKRKRAAWHAFGAARDFDVVVQTYKLSPMTLKQLHQGLVKGTNRRR